MEMILSDKYKLGIEALDRQHEKWIELYNQLHQLLQEGSHIDDKQIEGIIQEMYAYTSYHFKYEEDYMVSIQFPFFSEHRRLHSSMDSEIYSYYRMALNKDYIALREVLKLLRKWILNHILKDDIKIKDFLQNKET